MRRSIVRIEHPDSGLGIFWHDNNYLPEVTYCFRAMPTPIWDTFEAYNEENISESWAGKANLHLFCAFPDEDNFVGCINKTALSMIKECGFRIYEYIVDSYLISKYQVMFDKNKAIDKKDITDRIINEVLG
jgi:hypothetical protein